MSWNKETVLGEDEVGVMKELIPAKAWPGDKINTEKEPTTGMNIDYNNNKQLYYILQSARQILSTEDSPIEHRPWTSRHRRPLSPVKLPHQVSNCAEIFN